VRQAIEKRIQELLVSSGPRLLWVTCQGVKKYPELAALIPARPEEARDCDSCRGTGRIEALPQIICRCGGVGWIVPGEAGPLGAIG